MKRLIWMILAAALLCGCDADPDTPLPKETQVPQIPDGCYLEDSPVEQHSAGAVRLYVLPEGKYEALASMEGQLILVGGEGNITPLTGEKGILGKTVQTNQKLGESSAFSVTGDTVSYYHSEKNQVVLLDRRMVEKKRIDLPQEIIGEPCVSVETGEVYFCVDRQVRALNIKTGVSRLVLRHGYEDCRMIGCYLDGTVLAVQVADQNENVEVLYLKSENGQILHESETAYPIQAVGVRYLMGYEDGSVYRWLVGDAKQETICLNVSGQVVEAFEADAVVGCSSADGYAVLDMYELSTGLRTAGVTISNLDDVTDVVYHHRYVWLLARENGKSVLYRWDPVMTPSADSTVYTGKFYTLREPDLAGLKACEQRAKRMADTYGIRISLWRDAVAVETQEELTPEHRPEVLHRMLDELEPVLLQFPEGFLNSSIDGGKLHVCLIGKLGETEQYGQTYSNGDACILLTPQAELERAFLRCLGYVVDSHVLGNSRDFDTWDELNPEGFAYALTYGFEPEEGELQYLKEKNRYFTEELAMTYPQEDRSSLFMHATLPGNQSYFTGEAMQEKLCRLCEGIREAYGLEKWNGQLPWEQYLILEMDFNNGSRW